MTANPGYLRTSNPAFSRTTFAASPLAASSSEQMTINGTINRCLILLALILCGAGWVWSSFHNPMAEAPHPSLMGLIIGGALIGFIIALITMFKPAWSPLTAPIYALCEGVFLGGISSMLEMKFPGIAMQAVGLTFGTLAGMLIAYRAGIIRATEKFKAVVGAATLGIMIVYLASFILGFFGVGIPYIHGSGPIGIGGQPLCRCHRRPQPHPRLRPHRAGSKGQFASLHGMVWGFRVDGDVGLALCRVFDFAR